MLCSSSRTAAALSGPLKHRSTRAACAQENRAAAAAVCSRRRRHVSVHAPVSAHASDSTTASGKVGAVGSTARGLQTVTCSDSSSVAVSQMMIQQATL